MEYDLANGVVRFFVAKDRRGNDNLAYWSAGRLSRIDILDVDANPKMLLEGAEQRQDQRQVDPCGVRPGAASRS